MVIVGRWCDVTNRWDQGSINCNYQPRPRLFGIVIGDNHVITTFCGVIDVGIDGQASIFAVEVLLSRTQHW